MVFVCNVVCDRQLLLAAQRGCSQNSRYRKHIYAYISENVHVYSKRLQEVSLLLEGNGPTVLDVTHLGKYFCKSMYSPYSMVLNLS